MFRPILEEVFRKVEGAVSVSLMGTDGIPIEEIREPSANELNVDLISAEYAALQKRISKTNEGLDLTSLRELQVVTGTVAVVMTMVNDDYFLLLLIRDQPGLGRARYELRKAQIKLQGEIA